MVCGGLWERSMRYGVCNDQCAFCVGPDEQINPKKKIFEQIQVMMPTWKKVLITKKFFLQPDLATSDVLVATYRGNPLQTDQGTVGVKSLKCATIR